MPLDDGTPKGSEARLWTLINERTQEGADVAAIDARIWETFGEEWAVLISDLAGFSRNAAAFGIIHFLQIIYEHRRLLVPVIERHSGQVIKTEADNLMALFRQPGVALDCAVEMQRACQAASERRKPEEKILLCVGIGWGRLLRIGDADIWGAEVNAASKLGEDTAAANQILVTGNLRRAVGDPPGLEFRAIDVDVPGANESFRVCYRGADDRTCG